MDFQLPAWRTSAQVGYVAVVTSLVGCSHQDPNDVRTGAWVAALLLCLPMLVPMLLGLYLGGGWVWSVTDADSGGDTWPVTVASMVMLAAIATVNALVLRWGFERRS